MRELIEILSRIMTLWEPSGDAMGSHWVSTCENLEPWVEVFHQ